MKKDDKRIIIFDLDGTLADCEHRRHFVSGFNNKTDWHSFFQACDKDTPIFPVIDIWNNLYQSGKNLEIWSGRCESVREKTEFWLHKYLLGFETHKLRMRPIKNNTPDEILKESWILEVMNNDVMIECVFDDRHKVVEMWRNRGVFVFDCNQTGSLF